jgi:DinB superfamily
MSIDDDTRPLPDRFEAACGRFAATRPRVEAGAPWPLAERFDHAPEAAWGPPEVLAHVAEMLPYWLVEVDRVAAGTGEPVPFGRVGTDANRIDTIERDRSLPVGELYERFAGGFEPWTARLGTLTPTDLARVGAHPARGEMTVAAIIERMIVSHIDEHAEQLETLLGGANATG